MACHSHKMHKYCTGQNAIIPCVYISERLCTIDLFFADPNQEVCAPTPSLLCSDGVSSQDRYYFQQIGSYSYPFQIAHNGDILAARILCHLHNFAIMFKKPVPDQDKIMKLYRLKSFIGSMDLPSVSNPSTTGSTDESAHPTKKRKLRAREEGKHRAPPNAIQKLLAPYPTMRRVSSVSLALCSEIIFGFTFVSNSGPLQRGNFFVQKDLKLCAKWTSGTKEINIIRRLQSAQHPKYASHVVPVNEFIESTTPDFGSFIVMPMLIPINKLPPATAISRADCFDLQRQLAEVRSIGCEPTASHS